MTDQPNAKKYFTMASITATHSGVHLTQFQMDVTKAIQDNPIIYEEHQDEHGFMHLDQEDAEHCAIHIGEILREALAARDREVAAKAVAEVIDFLDSQVGPDDIVGYARLAARTIQMWEDARADRIEAVE